MDLDLRQVRYFLELARCLNFTKAARSLYIAQPALSQQIAELEKSLGVKLVNRTSRKVSLTYAGEILMSEGEKLLVRAEQMEQRVRLAEAGILGFLRIGYLEAPFHHQLATAIDDFRRSNPEVTLETIQYNAHKLRNALSAGDVDLALSFAFASNLIDGRYEHAGVGTADICLVIRKDHPFANIEPDDYRQLSSEPFVTLSQREAPSWDALVSEMCAELGIVTNTRMRCQMMTTIVMQVEAGVGFSILPSNLEAYASDKVKFIPLKKDCLEKIAIWKADSQNPTLPLFVDCLQHLYDSPAT